MAPSPSPGEAGDGALHEAVAWARRDLLRGHAQTAARRLARVASSLPPDHPGAPALLVDRVVAEVMRSRFRTARALTRAALGEARSGPGLLAAHALATAMVGPDAGPGPVPPHSSPVMTPTDVDAHLALARALAAAGPGAAGEHAATSGAGAQGLGSVRVDHLPSYVLAEAAMSCGELSVAESVARRAQAAGPHDPLVRLSLRHVLARSLAFQGRLDESADEQQALVRDSASVPDDGAQAFTGLGLAVGAWLAAQRGHDRSARELVGEACRASPASGYVRAGTWALCAYALSAGRHHDAAAAALLDGGGGPALPRLQWVDRAYGYELLAASAATTGDLAAAAAWLARAERLPGGRMATAAVERTRAVVRAAEGEGRLAAEAAGRARAAADGAGGALDAARATVLLGAGLGRSGSRRDALAALQAAATAAQGFGGESVRGDAVRELRRLGGRARRDGTGWDALSAREQQVCRLVADGLTSRQVARLLGISERTVSSHLSSVLRAVGAPSRTALTALVPRQPTGLGDDIPPLTARQAQVVALVARGWTDRQVGEALGISPRTVEKHLADARSRWGEPSRTALAARWRQDRPEPVSPAPAPAPPARG